MSTNLQAVGGLRHSELWIRYQCKAQSNLEDKADVERGGSVTVTVTT
jgi:hypothetical protein